LDLIYHDQQHSRLLILTPFFCHSLAFSGVSNRMAAGQLLHPDDRSIAGRDLFRVSNHGRAVLLDNPPGERGLGAPGLVGRWLHELAWLGKRLHVGAQTVNKERSG